MSRADRLFQRERTGLTYRVPALLLLDPRALPMLAFAEQGSAPTTPTPTVWCRGPARWPGAPCR